MFIQLRTYDGQRYVCAENGGGGAVNATRTWAAQWETFRLAPAQGGAVKAEVPVNFVTSDGMHYLCAESGGGREVVANRTVAAQWETFTVQVVPFELLFPMRINGESRLSTGKWVSGAATLSQDGRLHTEVHVWTQRVHRLPRSLRRPSRR